MSTQGLPYPHTPLLAQRNAKLFSIASLQQGTDYPLVTLASVNSMKATILTNPLSPITKPLISILHPSHIHLTSKSTDITNPLPISVTVSFTLLPMGHTCFSLTQPVITHHLSAVIPTLAFGNRPNARFRTSALMDVDYFPIPVFVITPGPIRGFQLKRMLIPFSHGTICLACASAERGAGTRCGGREEQRDHAEQHRGKTNFKRLIKTKNVSCTPYSHLAWGQSLPNLLRSFLHTTTKSPHSRCTRLGGPLAAGSIPMFGIALWRNENLGERRLMPLAQFCDGESDHEWGKNNLWEAILAGSILEGATGVWRNEWRGCLEFGLSHFVVGLFGTPLTTDIIKLVVYVPSLYKDTSFLEIWICSAQSYHYLVINDSSIIKYQYSYISK
ncbi:uncharacterized protein BDR25DRAFT_352663 [Lindgomyces ingoldianus]|uniref:Uncharacterized protein n=1 Tax=Lindgomyces ingoldianus TaxID=673940 RepID=A0ACB6R1S8_9PLEO|nr:uncharacterized protein BDR25DRAFT_352663 [Lindgomyces ingoldianus]KAF2473223.1 hypothetical protein BDR25DRAFT_352663 [Lindgomyces ingoldianus]